MLNNDRFESLLRAASEVRADDLAVEPRPPTAEAFGGGDIAIIGLSASVGEATSARLLWDAVNAGVDLIRDFPASRRRDAEEMLRGVLGGALGEPVPYAYLDDVSQFDPARFGISRAEAELMDPHQRLFLTACADALDDAGYGGNSLRGSKTGVYAASGLVPGLYLSGH